ncbi:MAG: RdgB/HAM1 family non-canonical purine NTP pyrophosphatase [Rickettsiales bacterium]|nr:RdgB/HAM1 family non-canonical purine NTP pyrophosphatase [Rickettsiales bacterium]
MTAPFEQLVIASHNAGKVREIDALLAPMGVQVKSAAELDLPEPVEDGDTFAANALIKSQSACGKSGLASLADDSGLAVPMLDGAPGIYSARWAGPNKDFDVAMKRLQTQGCETGTPAYFICVLALSQPDAQDVVFEGRVDGTLTFPMRGEKGFGYDPVFVPQGYDTTFAEMDAQAKQSISHRSLAFEKFVTFIEAPTK